MISDLTISRESINTTIYTDKSVNVFYNPVTTYDNQIMTNLSGTHQLSADKMAKTNWGTYYEVSLDNGQKGWVSENDISLENPKIKQVQALLNQKYNDKKYSIYVKELDDKFTTGVNQEQKMYSASLSKISILYWTQKRLNEGLASLDDKLLYTPAINTFMEVINQKELEIYQKQQIINITVFRMLSIEQPNSQTMSEVICSPIMKPRSLIQTIKKK